VVDEGGKSVTDKMVDGTIWMLFSKFVERGLGLVSTLVLLRLLSPDDFGLVATAMLVYGLVDILVTFGFDVALIQTRNVDRSHYDTAWTLQIIFYTTIAVVLSCIAPLSASYFNDERLTDVIYCLSFIFVISAFSNIGVVEFRRNLNFRKEFWFSIAKKTVALGVTVPLAYIMRSYWALVVGMLASKVLEVLLSYFMHSFRPRISLSKAREIMSFSKWVVFNSVISYGFVGLPVFVISKFFGTSEVGYYTVSREVVEIPTTEMVSAINRATLPGYAKKSTDINELKCSYFNVLAVIFIVTLPVGIGIMSVAEVLVPVVLGLQWVSTIDIFLWLSPSAMLMALVSNSWVLNASVGRPEVTSFVNFVSFSFLLSVVFFMFDEVGYLWVVKAVFFFSIFYFFLSILCSIFVVNAEFVDFLFVSWRPVLSSVVMFFFVDLFLAADFVGDVFRLFVSVFVGFFVYLISIFILWLISGLPDGAERFIIDKALAVFRCYR